jgi:hypothetical protein
MKFRILPTILAAIFVLFGCASAQKGVKQQDPINPAYERAPIYLGPVFGYNRSMHTVELASFDEAICPRFQNGNSNGFYLGISYEEMLGDINNSTSSIIARVLYNTMPASLETSEAPIPSLVTIVDGNGNPTDETVLKSSTLHTQEIKYSMITAEVMYKLNFIPGVPLGITVGPTFDFAMSKTQDQRYNLVQPLEAQFKRNQAAIDQGYKYVNDDRTIIIKEGDIPDGSSFRLGIKAGVQYEILMSSRMYVVPSLYYNFGVTNLSSRENWRVNALQMGVDVRFSI